MPFDLQNVAKSGEYELIMIVVVIVFVQLTAH